MAEHVIKLTDVGEGIAEAELVEWRIGIGDAVREDDILAAVMTDKATVEIPSPADGEVIWLGAEIGDTVAVGAALVRLKVTGASGMASESADAGPPTVEQDRLPLETEPPRLEDEAQPPQEPEADVETQKLAETQKPPKPLRRRSAPTGGAPRPEGEKPLASPAVRLRAKEAGIDLRQVTGAGPAGRITHEDLDLFLKQGDRLERGTRRADTSVEEVRIVGVRRRIAEKMALANSRIPHITYVEEVDVSALEELRGELNNDSRGERPRLTVLPFLACAMVRAIAEYPQMNAVYDDEAGVVHRHGGVHLGIATQTAAGLMVPVVRHAETRGLWNCGAEISRLAEAAKSGAIQREELSGSTITITSLGALGGIVTTPVINHPEVAIIGVNKIVVRPVWESGNFRPRKIMNLSSSFDHRIIDGWDAALFVHRIKSLLETPAMLFVEG
jgi:2-oxoisovalerate dehydrogenase E2 component (dihydrolipoyl transacylase)